MVAWSAPRERGGRDRAGVRVGRDEDVERAAGRQAAKATVPSTRAPSPNPPASQAGLAKTLEAEAAGGGRGAADAQAALLAEDGTSSTGRGPLGPSGPVSMPRPPLALIRLRLSRAVAPGSTRDAVAPVVRDRVAEDLGPGGVDAHAGARRAGDRVAVVLARPADLAGRGADVDATPSPPSARDHLAIDVA